MYHVLRNLLFRLPAETSHELTLEWLAAAERMGILDLMAPKVPDCPVEVMGLRFPNPVGLAAGLDKNADAFNAFAALGFGFVEVGTVTPRPQPGNPKPRLFRLPAQQAIINRMGFNNKGLDHLVARVQKRRFDGVLGINIGKNFDTPLERAVDDYLAGMDKAYPWADYLTVNVSSPNTPGLRSLQFGDSLAGLLTGLKQRQEALSQQYERYVPVAIKIAPDMSDDELKHTADALVDKGMDAVVATNTTLSREGVEGDPLAAEAGGLSGAPLTERSTAVVATLAQHLDGALPVIAVGGICSGLDAAEKIRVGASLVQIYTGFIYRGPALVREAVEAIRKLV